MVLKLFNYLTRKKEILRPIKKGRIGLYTCGPTVYNYAHIGNLRTYIFEDVLRRTLEYHGYKISQVMNLTDVDDKTIRDSGKAEKTLKEFTEFYAKEFFKDLVKLNILRALKYPRATAHISEMIALINTLLKKGLAYKTNDGIYFDISKFKRYGKLSGVKKRELKAGARVSADEYSKEEARDFALWKTKKPGEPSWKAPFGQGRPGWHIECSAMSMKYLGRTFDIHAGAVDLLFPHHEDEIAQSEGATGKQFVNYFIEGEHLLVDGKKMSKSLGNVYTLRDLEAKGFHPLDFRYFTLGAHYRTQLNFTWEGLGAASRSREKLNNFIQSLVQEKKRSAGGVKSLKPWKEKFENALANDLDMPKALAVLWKLIHAYHKTPQAFDAKKVTELLGDFDRVLGLALNKTNRSAVPAKIKALAAEREALRKEKKWKESDKIREEIKRLGFTVEDTTEGPRVRREYR